MPHAPTTTRWCPTPEQLMILEEMYKNGLRTPNASQIQQITRQLSGYGRIEGKNVFYWFQNHKARDRQKLRRRLSSMSYQYHLFAQAQLQNVLMQHQLMEQQGCLVSPHSTTAFLPPFVGIHQTPPSSVPFFHQDGVVPMQDAIVQEPAATFLIGSESRHPWETAHSMAATHAIQVQHQDWMMATGTEPAPPSSCRPLKTLDLFPTKSTGLKEECISSKSSSSCTTTYY